jgi:WD40 repeat protein
MLATANLTGITLWDHTFNPVARLSSRFRHGATTRRPQVRYLEMEGKGLLVLAQSDHTIEILDVQSGRLISTLPCHHAINDFGVFYTTKGHPRLAIGEAGGEISIWDPSVDAPISTFAWGTEEITTLRAIRV